MKNIRGLTLLALTAMLLLLPLFVTQVAATAILETPINKKIECLPGKNFTLAHKMQFQEDDDGYFSTTFYWDNNESLGSDARYLNFTYLDKVVKFTDGTGFSGTINVDIKKAVPSGYPAGYYRYTVSVWEDYGESYGTEASPKDFWVNVTMKNAGLVGGVYYNHMGVDQNITIVKVRCNELTQIEAGPGDALIRSGIRDVAVTGFKLKRTVVARGISGAYTKILVNVSNQGDFAETFNVTLSYKNSTIPWTALATKPVTNLASKANTTVEFRWDTVGLTAYTRYKINATASVLLGETDVADNTKVSLDATTWSDYLTVSIQGDIDGNGWVYLPDMGAVGKAWNSRQPIAWWNPGKYIANADCADYNGWIYLADMGAVGKNWNKRVTIRP